MELWWGGGTATNDMMEGRGNENRISMLGGTTEPLEGCTAHPIVE